MNFDLCNVTAVVPSTNTLPKVLLKEKLEKLNRHGS